MMEKFRLETCARELERNGFNALVLSDPATAGEYIRMEIERLAPDSISLGDSMSLLATGFIDELRRQGDSRLIDGFDKSIPREEQLERRRQGMLADLYLTGINAVSMQGTLHWLDMIGNRIAPIAYGPRHVILVAGRNKIVETPEEADQRIREIAAPLNIARHEGFKTPCAITGVCTDCSSPQRICNTWMTMVKCFPKGRITVLLIDRELGL